MRTKSGSQKGRYKLVVLVRDDLKLSKGKACAQVGHAVLECYLRQDDKRLKQVWLEEGGKKVILKVGSLKELFEITEAARQAGLITAIVEDAGQTEVPPKTITCVGIGPDREEKIDKITRNLPPL